MPNTHTHTHTQTHTHKHTHTHTHTTHTHTHSHTHTHIRLRDIKKAEGLDEHVALVHNLYIYKDSGYTKKPKDTINMTYTYTRIQGVQKSRRTLFTCNVAHMDPPPPHMTHGSSSSYDTCNVAHLHAPCMHIYMPHICIYNIHIQSV